MNLMVFISPENIELRDKNELSLFLGGSIENGSAANWQDDLISKLKNSEEDEEH